MTTSPVCVAALLAVTLTLPAPASGAPAARVDQPILEFE